MYSETQGCIEILSKMVYMEKTVHNYQERSQRHPLDRSDTNIYLNKLVIRIKRFRVSTNFLEIMWRWSV